MVAIKDKIERFSLMGTLWREGGLGNNLLMARAEVQQEEKAIAAGRKQALARRVAEGQGRTGSMWALW